MEPLLILPPSWTPKNARVTLHFGPLPGAPEGRSELATSEFVPFSGDP